MDATKVLLIGRSQGKNNPFINSLKKRYSLILAANGTQAVALARQQSPDIAVLDAASMRTSGERICRTLNSELPGLPVVHIHPGPEEAANSPADIVLFQPFTSRKLLNSIERLVKFSDDQVLTCGPFVLNVARRTLDVYGQETQLTPKVAMLIELFLRQPGIVLDRKSLMTRVWNTDYMGDTRTLDVHIRWIREIIEENPGKPLYLKTVRGVGYRLDVDVQREPALEKMPL